MTEINDISYKLGEMHGDIKSILVEAKKTNGRVGKLEDDVKKVNLKIAYYSGVAAVVLFIIKFVIDKYL